MELQDIDLTTYFGCDESKCVSTAQNDRFNYSFTCYSDNASPMMCADGFLPVIVDDAIFRHLEIGGDESANYFTCCPPQEAFSESLSGYKPPSRQCSDPITIDADENDESIEFLCINQDTRKYPRQMESNWNNFDGDEVKSFICCDSNITLDSHNDGGYESNSSNNTNVSSAINFLGEAECVPYRDDYYYPAQVKNEIGLLRPMVCDFSDNDFAFPRLIDGEEWNASGSYRYQCCRNGPAHPPFITDTAFKITLYPVLVLNCIAAVVSIVAAVGLLIPLLAQLKNGTYRRSSISESRRISRSLTRSVSNREPRYSTYNLYLVYLALLDLAFCIFQIGMFSACVGQNFHPGFFSWIVGTPTFTDYLSPDFLTAACYGYANMFINAILCHEVLKLLKASKFAKRINDPSLKKVNLQVGVAILASLVIGICLYYANEYSTEMVEIILVTIMTLLSAVPFFYVIYVTVLIWWRGYIPSWHGATANERGLRQLTLYFSRIVGVFLLIWIPCTVLAVVFRFNISGTWGKLSVFVLMGVQPILTFCVILTKEDAKKYIVDLVTFSYCSRKNPEVREENGRRDSVGDISMTMNASSEQQC